MISLDTNVLVRLLVDDPDNPKQNKQARALADKHKKFYITQIVQTELYWVLERCYHFSKEALLIAFNEIMMNDAFLLENEGNFDDAIQLFKSSNVDFSDVLILTQSTQAQAKCVVTFDKKFARLPKVQLVK